jgi:hypothetical protein
VADSALSISPRAIAVRRGKREDMSVSPWSE